MEVQLGEAVLELPDDPTEEQVFQVFEACQALLSGHFLLTSGRHSDRYLEKFQALQFPAVTDWFGAVLAARLQRHRVQPVHSVRTVVGPATGGILLSHVVARRLGQGSRALFTERVEGRQIFRRGFRLSQGQPVFVVEDVITTGSSVREVLDAVVAAGGRPAALGVLVDRSGGSADFGSLPVEALLHLDIPSWPADQCPLCRRGVPLTERGSRHL